MVTGTGKQKILEEIMMMPTDSLPASFVTRNRQTEWILAPDCVSPGLLNYLQSEQTHFNLRAIGKSPVI
jgi:hypothetical protein